MSIAEPLLSPDPEVLSDAAEELLVSVVIPCLNEAENIERCVAWALTTLAENGIAGEVVVADNASEDGSAALAARPARASSTSAAAATATPTWPASPPPAAATS